MERIIERIKIESPDSLSSVLESVVSSKSVKTRNKYIPELDHLSSYSEFLDALESSGHSAFLDATTSVSDESDVAMQAKTAGIYSCDSGDISLVKLTTQARKYLIVADGRDVMVLKFDKKGNLVSASTFRYFKDNDVIMYSREYSRDKSTDKLDKAASWIYDRCVR